MNLFWNKLDENITNREKQPLKNNQQNTNLYVIAVIILQTENV